MKYKQNINNQTAPEYDHFLSVIFNMSANEQALYASLIGIVLCQDLTIREQNSLGNFLMLIAQEMLTINAQNTLIEARNLKRNGE